MGKQPNHGDAAKLRDALSRATSTPHRATMVEFKKENERDIVRRNMGGRFASGGAAAPPKRIEVKPSARKQNDANNAYLAKGSALVKGPTLKEAMRQSGIGPATKRGFGIAPLTIL